eukprot:324424-Pelagomonas_calceolata.AAC.10
MLEELQKKTSTSLLPQAGWIFVLGSRPPHIHTLSMCGYKSPLAFQPLPAITYSTGDTRRWKLTQAGCSVQHIAPGSPQPALFCACREYCFVPWYTKPYLAEH